VPKQPASRRPVFDASAIVAVLNGEPGSEGALPRMDGAAISAVNLAEVASYLSDRGASADEVSYRLGALRLDVFPLDGEQALEVGALRRSTRASGLSLADRACLALAARLNGVALTTDRAWSKLDIGVEIELIR